MALFLKKGTREQSELPEELKFFKNTNYMNSQTNAVQAEHDPS